MGQGVDVDDELPTRYADGTLACAWGWEAADHSDRWHVAAGPGERLTAAQATALAVAAGGTMVGFLAALNASPAGPAWARAEAEAQARGQVTTLRATAKRRWASRVALTWQEGFLAA
jgi:hypothetical protein